jgi:dTDP-4-dehydrorhamnose 3,5-epimerase
VIFTPTTIHGAFLLRPETFADERGFFARLWEPQELEANGLDGRLAHASVSWNRRRATLRGMHYQVAPFEETKLVACPRGAIHDVIVDMRPGSPTLRRWFGVRLGGERLEMLYVPRGVAHGFLTLEDDTLVQYFISERYSSEHARGVRWDDPALGIEWPGKPAVVTERDLRWPLLDGERP